ncbi:MipA/OmpV family protein [Paraglaciecola sp.]|uniref:MipA/OmpV family protein n=1 Tax=Paraglaciecola sp. TaxID=1920173 RepID=UPI0030F49F0D
MIGNFFKNHTLSFICCCTLTFNASASDDYILEIGMGAAAGQLPEYLGSPDTYEFLLPLPYIYYRDESLTINRNTLSDELYQLGPLSLSLSASGSIPVKSREDSLRSGMPDLGWVGELGPSLDYQIMPELTLALQLRKAIGVEDWSFKDVGWHASTTLIWHKILFVHNNLGELSISSRLSLDYADRNYHQYYYGVALEHQTLNRPLYEAKAGFSHSGMALGLSWRYQQLWLGVYAKYFDLSRAANFSSPLLVNKQQASFGLAFSWIFWTNNKGR